MEQIKLRESFYYGLSKRTQLEMTRLNIHDIDSMFTIIDTTEEALNEQLSETLIKSKSNKSGFKSHKTQTKNESKKFCSYHKTNTHDDTTCRAIKKENKLKIYNSNREKDQKRCNPMIKESKVETQTLETEVTINDKSYIFLLDTGSAFSYVERKLIEETNLKCEDTNKTKAILIGGTAVESSQEANLELFIQGDKTTRYKVRAKIINDMSLAGILGMDFLLSNHAKIDLSEGTISLDNKYYELKLKENTTEFESKLLQKTKINAQVSSA
ncbi:hypothetical protein DMUE_4785, partial [Dictyocoela muelleri]